MDAAVIALASSISVAVIGGAVTVIGIIVNSRTERGKTAKAAMDEAHQRELRIKDERITLRDEQVADCQEEVAYWKARAERAEKKR